MLKQIESQRSTGCDLLLLLSGGDERINTTSTSDWRKTVPRHICRHSPINETNGRLRLELPPRLGMTYVVLEGAYLCSMRLCADCDGEQKKKEKKQNRKELPSLSRNSMSMGLRISLFASLGGSDRLVVVFVPHIGRGFLSSSISFN